MASTSKEEDLSRFECPVCYDYTCPPFRPCENGHALCGRCFQKTFKCPVCRSAKSYARSIVLEEKHALLTFPCRYAEYGCDFVGKGSIIKSHQRSCRLRTWTCEIFGNYNCNFRGPRQSYLRHIELMHGAIVYGIDEKWFISTLLLRPILFDVYDTIFHIAWSMDVYGNISFTVEILDDVTYEEKKFYYCLEIFLEEGSKAPIARHRRYCQYMPEDDVIGKENIIVIDTQYARNVFNYQGPFYFNVSIHRTGYVC